MPELLFLKQQREADREICPLFIFLSKEENRNIG
jgi:hypothetical protein